MIDGVRQHPTLLFVGCALICAGSVCAQGRGPTNWTTAGYDAQRTSWVRTDSKISSESMAKPGFGLLWKLKLEGPLTPMVVLDPYTGYRGHKSLGYLSGASDDIYGIDTDLGIVEWHNRVSVPAKATCADAVTSGVARPTNAAIQSAPAGRGGGARSAVARSGVGEPLKGAVNLASIAPPRSAAATAVAPVVPAAAAVARPNAVYGVTRDGMLQTMYVSNGADAEPPLKFVPPGAIVQGLIVVDNVAYAGTTSGCNSAPNGVWALDLISKEVHNWTTNATTPGTAAPAFGPDGTVYWTDGLSLGALAPRTLRPTTPVAMPRQEFTSSPVVFRFNDRILLAATERDGVHLFDSKTLAEVGSAGGNFASRALAAWQDASGTNWILGSTANAVTAWKVMNQNGVPALQADWVSRNIASPVTPAIVNGVVFVATGGDSPAVVYALDALTGKELWGSGKTVTSFVHTGGLSVGAGQVYLSTEDGTMYAFGFPMEH